MLYSRSLVIMKSGNSDNEIFAKAANRRIRRRVNESIQESEE